jgi:hypothetical protein
MPLAPFGDDLWLTPGIRAMLRRLRLRLEALLAKITTRFDPRCMSA